MSTMGAGAGGKGRSSLRSGPGTAEVLPLPFRFPFGAIPIVELVGLRGYWKNASSVTVLGTGEGVSTRTRLQNDRRIRGRITLLRTPPVTRHDVVSTSALEVSFVISGVL